MSYRGRPSRGCEQCRRKRVKCDETKPVCSRCSKAGHKCAYRDQADLLFRNQTAFAAQKAEDSWRKRSKLRQRASTEPNRSSQQNVLSLPPHDKCHEVTPEESRAFQFAPELEFNETSIPSRVRADLRRLAYERFVYDFVVFETPNRPPDAVSEAIWDFIPTLYHRAPEESCLVTIVDAVAYANFANRRDVPQALALAEGCLGKAIKLLREAITDIKQAPTDEALCTAYLIGVYGDLTINKSGSDLTDSVSIGVHALLQLRSMDELYANSTSARLYEVSLTQMLVGTLQAGKAPPLPIENIVTTRQCQPGFYSTSGINFIQLIHKGAQLHAKWHETKRSLIPPTSRGDLQELLQTALDLDAEFQAWESTVPRELRYQMERNTPDARCTYDPKWHNLILGSRGAPEEIHTHTTLRGCWMWMFYRTSRIFLLRDLLEILNWMFKLPEPCQFPNDPTAISNRSASRSLDNVGLQIHHSFATMHLANIIEKSCSAVLGHFTVPIYGKSDHDVVGIRGFTMLWSLGTIDSVLKAGLVPDEPAPPSPPRSEVSPHASRASIAGFDTPAPSPVFFRMPPQDMHPYYHTSPVQTPPTNEFPSLSSVPVLAQKTNPPGASSTSAATPPTRPSNSLGHVFDSSPPHPFDRPTALPPLDFTITEPVCMDIAARREWLNCLLYYIATELGIKKAISVPASEGYLELCKTRVETLLFQ